MNASRFSSQSFLGDHSEAVLADVHVGIVGLSGGGSHIVQQLAHLGVSNFTVIDHDRIELKNLNRLVGATAADVAQNALKTDIARRVIHGVNPQAQVACCPSLWQQALPQLRACDIVFGCVDSFKERNELERFCRRFLIHYIDVGMDIHPGLKGFSMGGQVVLSSPGGPCLRCLGILTDARLSEEARRYGQQVSAPQVVWPNGVLASLAVGLFVQLVCPWHDAPVATYCAEFDGNRHLVEGSRMAYADQLRCQHFPENEVGDQFFTQG